jgi:hypothetical protein
MALTNYEVLYLGGYHNSIDLQLWASGTGTTESSAVSLAAVTEIKLKVGGIVIDSTDAASGDIRWNQAGYKTGEIRVFGSSALSTGDFRASLAVYDPTNSSGVIWDDNIPIRVKSNPLAT